MMKLSLSLVFKLSLLILSSICASGKITLAQVTPDSSSINTQVNQNGNVAEITGGQTRGGNLFHSFQDFSVPTGNEAFFNNANNISNILGRVTGGNISNIDGLIRANGSANLFLINPAGIVFGQNARLDIGGSFLGSTSSSILFEDGEFSATDLENPPLLTINAPIGLGFRDNPGDIVNRSTFDGVGLAVNEGESISLIGGNVNIENGGIVSAPGGRVELGGLLATGTINIAEDNSLTFPSDLARGDVSITDSSIVSVFLGASNSLSNAGNIDITTSSLTLNNGSSLVASNEAFGNGGNIIINATDNVSLANSSTINVFASGGGSVTIDAKNLELTTGSNIIGGIFTDAGTEEAQAGDITINTSEDVLIDAAGEELTQISNSNFGTGNAGDVVINSRNVSLINGGAVFSFNNGRGSTGNISINATGDISFDGITRSQLGGIRNFSSQIATGTVGNIELQAQNLTITNGASIASQVAGETNSGDINIDIIDTISIDGSQEVISSDGTSSRLPSGIFSNVVNNSIGNSGDININTQNLFLSRNGNIDASIFGRGSAGDININAELITIGEPGNTSLVPSSISSQVIGSSEAAVEEVNGGNITIDTGSVFISDGGDINVGISSDFANSTGTGGNITINAIDTVSVDGTGFIDDTEVSSEISADIGRNSTGNAGNIAINTAQLLVTNDAFISADILQEANGNGGNIDISATDLSVANSSFISADIFSEANGNGGNIEVDAERISLADSFISADILSGASGNAGLIDISATDSIELSDSNIQTIVLQGATGNGGNLNIETGSLILRDVSQIAVSTFGNGNAGNLSIIATESIDLSGADEVNQFRGGLFAKAAVSNGNAGNLNVVTDELNITDGATIEAGNFPSFETSDLQPGTGEPGNINIEANSINLSNEGRIDAATQSPTGEGANINLQVADDITLRNNSLISARAFNLGNGGNLSIDARFIVAFPNGNNDIIASAEQGNGGNININAESLFGIEERPLNDSTNDINASSEFSLDGSITINTPDLNPLQGTTELPQNVVQPEQTTAQACAANGEAVAKNSLTIEGKGGIPNAPDLPLDSHNISINGETETNTAPVIPEPIETAQGKIQPARGIKFTESGKIILTAYPTDNSGKRIPEAKINCGI